MITSINQWKLFLVTERSVYTVPDATRKMFLDINRKAAADRNIRTDGDFIFLFHGTSRQNMNKIVNSGMLKSGTWLTPDLDEANRYAYTKGGSPVIDTFAVYMGSLVYNGYFNTQEDLILKDGHYAPKNYINESVDGVNGPSEMTMAFVSNYASLDDEYFQELIGTTRQETFEEPGLCATVANDFEIFASNTDDRLDTITIPVNTKFHIPDPTAQYGEMIDHHTATLCNGTHVIDFTIKQFNSNMPFPYVDTVENWKAFLQ